MKIDSSAIGMESARSYRASNVSVRRFQITDYRETFGQGSNALNAAISDNQADAAQSQEKDAAKESVNNLQEWQNRFGVSPSSRITVRSRSENALTEIRQMTIRYIFDLLFAVRRGRLQQWREEQGFAGNGAQQTQEQTQNQMTSLQPLSSNMKIFAFSQESWQTEEEAVSFSTTGTVRTADGREINFNVDLGMSRSFEQYFREDLEAASVALCDPLVINFDGDTASLTDQRFFFDIDADGEEDEIAGLGSGSGYLALDKNGDGIINDGSELFGTSSGDGFADLAAYDGDGNGWIDENDEIWSKLKIWCREPDGTSKLYRLADKGVGAIYLGSAATDFSLKNGANETLGAIRSTGVFLYENGSAGTIQHVDVAKYNQSA